MLKSVYVKNIKGLRGEHFLNFEAKGLKQTQIDSENSIGVVNRTKIMKAPILIAKNSSGKSTMLDAIEMGMRYKDLDEYLKSSVDKAVEKHGDSLINIARPYFKEITKRFVAKEGGEHFVKTDEVSKTTALHVFNELVGEIRTRVARYGGSITFPTVTELSKETLTDFARKSTDEIESLISGIILSEGNIHSFFDMGEEFEIKIEDVDGTIRSINNKNLSSEDILKIYINMINRRIEDEISLPIWDSMHILSEVIEESTGVYNEPENLEFNHETKSFSKLKALTDEYPKDQIYTPHLFGLLPSGLARSIGGRSRARDAIYAINKGLGQTFLESFLLILDKNISHIEQDGRNIKIINKREKNIAPESLSFGTQKVLELVHFAIRNKDAGFVMVDEIENGLNISLINLVYRLFDELDLQVISTTHNPSIIYQGIVSPINAFVNNGKSFVSARDVLEVKRPANLVSLFRPENYMNDFHIVSNALDGFSTNSISSFELDKLLDIIEEEIGADE